MPRIYTRTGDRGDTSLWRQTGTPRRVPKEHPRIEACGAVDELSAHLGLVRALLDQMSFGHHLIEGFQRDLHEVGAELATPDLTPEGYRVTAARVKELEREIDRMEGDLPRLTRFILPGGDPAAAACHVARTVCRRAERRAAALQRVEPGNPELGRYLNRLSDLLFVLGRHLAKAAGRPEIQV